jgi:hypothetical protein
MSQFQFLGTVSAPFTIASSNQIIDFLTGAQMVIPANHIITSVFMKASVTLSDLSTLSVGWTGALGAILAASSAITTTTLNTNDVGIFPSGIEIAINGNKSLLLTSTLAVTSGTIKIIINTVSAQSLPPAYINST